MSDDEPEAGRPPPATTAPGSRAVPSAVESALVPSLPSALFAAVLATLAYFRLGSLLVLAILLGVSIAYLSEAPSTTPVSNARERLAAAPAGDELLGGPTEEGPASPHYHEPTFVNHALSRLWPMINTDLFTPVLDLLEDTLHGEVPPMVHSVRIESLELGKAPCRLKWLRPLTDEEWADGLRAVEGGGAGKLADRSLGEGEIEGGDYANFEIAFELDTAGCAPMDKAGILAVFGVGLKGVGGVECPVFIDILRVSGVVRVRLLLDPSPPFVRTGTFTFPKLPEFDISAAPLKRHGRGSLNAMKIPGLMTYVLKAMNRVAVDFVSPEAWSMDLDTLLAGDDSAIRTKNIGVLQIKIHRAVDLRAADANGSSDPYVAISWWKQLDKPLFSTRTILKELCPVWEETAFILVSADAIETGEKLVCQVYDSDRFNADDSLGSVEVDLADLVRRGRDLQNDESVDKHQLDERDDDLSAPRYKRSGRGQGQLAWAVRFYPLKQLSTTSSQQVALESHGTDDVKALATSEKGNIEKPSRNFIKPLYHPPPALLEADKEGWSAALARWAERWMPSQFEWEQERLQRREENVRWLAGKRGIELAEIKALPSLDHRAGILQWNIVQCQDLQIRPLTGGFDKSARSKAGGVPALVDTTDQPEGEAPAPVSAYAEVILNDRLAFKTRAKARQSSPYFNASSERFIRDWTAERLTIVIRDERDREKDAILGVIDFPTLADIFTQSSSVTRWYPLRGGLGWGIVRLSFLWKAIDIDLPRGISGYDVVSVSVRSVRALELSPSVSPDTLRSTSVSFETESDSQTVSGATADSSSELALQNDDRQSVRSSKSGASSGSKVFSWDLPSSVVLAVKYRLSTFLVIKFFTRSGGLKKKTQVWAIGMLKLGDVTDNELVDVGVPMYSTSDVNEAAMLAVTQTESDVMQRQIGTAFLSLRISPGLGKVHRALVKADPHFGAVDEAKQVVAQVEIESSAYKQLPGSNTRHDRASSLSSHFSLESAPKIRTTRSPSKSASVAPPVPESPSMDSFTSGGRDRESTVDDDGSSQEEEDEEAENEDYYRNRERDPKLFHEGISSHKAVRSGRWAKEKIAGKLSGLSLKHKRQEGTSHRVEKEGISRL